MLDNQTPVFSDAAADEKAAEIFSDFWNGGGALVEEDIQQLADIAGFASVDEMKSDFALMHLMVGAVAFGSRATRPLSLMEANRICKELDTAVLAGKLFAHRPQDYFASKSNQLFVDGVRFSAIFFYMVVEFTQAALYSGKKVDNADNKGVN